MFDDGDYDRDAEKFLLEPAIEYLRGYKKITNCQEAIARAEEVVRNETKVILAARERVLDAFRSTVEVDSNDGCGSGGSGGGGGDVDDDAETERATQRPSAVHENGARSPGGGTVRKTCGGHGRPSPGIPKSKAKKHIPMVMQAVRPEDSVSQRHLRLGGGNPTLPAAPSPMVSRDKHLLPIGPVRQRVRLGSSSHSSPNNNKHNGRVEFFSGMEDLQHSWDQTQGESGDPVIALYRRVDRWRSGHPQSFMAPSDYTST